MLQWLQENQTLLWWLTGLSLLAFVGTLLVVPALDVRIPHDYFAHPERPPGRWAQSHPALRLAARVAKNVIGGLLVLVGLALLVLPGQGLLTILLGFLMLDFPGKYAFEKRLIARPRVRAALDWLRRRASREPLELERT
jgi:hypothetical protein